MYYRCLYAAYILRVGLCMLAENSPKIFFLIINSSKVLLVFGGLPCGFLLMQK